VSEGSAKAPQKDPGKGTAKPRKFQAIKGTRDILPPDTALWNRVEQTAHEVFATYGFGEIRLPIFEETDLFARSIGFDTDVVSKEMYTFIDRPVEIPKPHNLNDLPRFLLEVEHALKNNEIPNTTRNRKTVEVLERTFSELETLSAQVKAGNINEAFDRQYRELLFQCSYLAAYVELGIEVTLRPEATASVCRAYIEHGMYTLPQPVKLYCLGPMFRRERPQKGRYRQFYQIDAEVLGGPDAPAVDAELIEMLMVYFRKLGLEGARLDINSIGCQNCRPKYVELLREALRKVKDKLGLDSQRRIETNPLRVFDSKLQTEQGVIAKLPHITDHLCADCAQNYADVKRELALRNIAFQQNWRLVRGLDYYMRTTFEIIAPGLGAQNAVCGGGRYDGLVELLGGPPTKGIGFAIGEDRLILSLQESGKPKKERGLDVFIAWMGEPACKTAVRAARTLRDAGLSVELPGAAQKFSRALGQADKLGARYALILGEDEIASGQWTVKRLADGRQSKLSETDLLKLLKQEQSMSS